MNTASPLDVVSVAFHTMIHMYRAYYDKGEMPRGHKTRPTFMFWPYLNFLNIVTRGESIERRNEGNALPRRPHAAMRCSTYFVCARVCLPFLKCHLYPNAGEAQRGAASRDGRRIERSSVYWAWPRPNSLWHVLLVGSLKALALPFAGALLPNIPD